MFEPDEQRPRKGQASVALAAFVATLMVAGIPSHFDAVLTGQGETALAESDVLHRYDRLVAAQDILMEIDKNREPVEALERQLVTTLDLDADGVLTRTDLDKTTETLLAVQQLEGIHPVMPGSRSQKIKAARLSRVLIPFIAMVLAPEEGTRTDRMAVIAYRVRSRV